MNKGAGKAGWETKRLGDICGFEGGSQPPKSQFIYGKKPGYVRFLQIRDFGNDRNITFIPESEKNRRCEQNDILIGRYGASVGKILTGKAGAYNVALMKTIPNLEVLDRSWFYNYLISGEFQSRLLNVADRSAQDGFSKDDIHGFPVPVPPRAEQQRIVGILDEAFDGIATAKASAEKNLQNARALFESHLQSVFTQRGKGWEDRTLDQVCIVERGSSPRPIKKYFTTNSDGVNWIKIGDTEEGGKYVYSTAQKITPVGSKQSRYVKEGDFILTNSMSFGRPYIMKTSGYIHDGWFVLRLNASIDTDYFYYLLSSRFIQSQFARLACGAVVKNISGDLVKKAVLPIPPLTHQHVIVKKLLELSAETQHLEAIYQGKLTALDELKKSLLHDAFRGAL